MKKVRIITNPTSGRQDSSKKIEQLCLMLLDSGISVSLFKTKGKNDAKIEASRLCSEDIDLIIAAGGDGTLNEIVSGIMQCQNRKPLAIFASGTVNDFAKHMKLPTNAQEFFNLIERWKVQSVDVGKVNDRYFINVAAGGFLTNVAYTAQQEAKAVLGKAAYYIEGIKNVIQEGMDPVKVRITCEEYPRDEEEIMLFIISNSSSIGGFKNLAPTADVSDGLLDVMLFKKAEIADLANIFINLPQGEHINHPKVSYFKTKSITIDTNEQIVIDLDGERGGKLPAHFEVIPKAIDLLI